MHCRSSKQRKAAQRRNAIRKAQEQDRIRCWVRNLLASAEREAEAYRMLGTLDRVVITGIIKA